MIDENPNPEKTPDDAPDMDLNRTLTSPDSSPYSGLLNVSPVKSVEEETKVGRSSAFRGAGKMKIRRKKRVGDRASTAETTQLWSDDEDAPTAANSRGSRPGVD